MTSHIQITFTDIFPEQQELLIAQLAEAGFEGFEENETELKAFIPEKDYQKQLLQELAFKYQLHFTEQVIPEQNWNQHWESNFQPVRVDDFVFIRAAFHPPGEKVMHEILITPKMSFGTGHHATTFMMVQHMREMDFTGKKVFDFGTGTGILAILAEKLGAASILATDNDDWSISNAAENLVNNDCTKVNLQQFDSVPSGERFDIILANINKNVILENLAVLAKQLAPGGILLLSGLLAEDEPDILAATEPLQLVFTGKQLQNNWISLRFSH